MCVCILVEWPRPARMAAAAGAGHGGWAPGGGDAWGMGAEREGGVGYDRPVLEGAG
jgi:hypothetical protein